MKKTNRILYLAAALLFIIVGWVIAMHSTTQSPNKIQGTESSWWDTRLPDLSDTPQPLAQYRGKPLVVNFWASWCASCLAEAPTLLRVYREYAPKGIQFIAIAIDSAAHTEKFVQHNRIPYPVYVAGFAGVDLARALGNTQGGLPFTVIFDASGRIRHTALGKLTIAELRQQLNRL